MGEEGAPADAAPAGEGVAATGGPTPSDPDAGLRLVAAGIEVEIAPNRGAKITSLLDTRAGREWLEPPAGPLIGDSGALVGFEQAEMCGWDEMLPTIEACLDPSSGIELPDHGEVWDVPWEVLEADGSSIRLAVTGRYLDYRLERTAVVAPDRLRLEYVLEATAGPLRALWAAHPMFSCRPGTRVELDPAIDTVLDITDPDRPVEREWSARGMGPVGDLPAGRAGKFEVPAAVHPGWVRLADVEGTALTMSWDPGLVPYLGIWLDHLGHARGPVAALEPSTGFYDALPRAVTAGSPVELRRGTPWRWAIDVNLTR
jgi:hypothetical protein